LQCIETFNADGYCLFGKKRTEFFTDQKDAALLSGTQQLLHPGLGGPSSPPARISERSGPYKTQNQYITI
jgi:hypothetical protein